MCPCSRSEMAVGTPTCVVSCGEQKRDGSGGPSLGGELWGALPQAGERAAKRQGEASG